MVCGERDSVVPMPTLTDAFSALPMRSLTAIIEITPGARAAG
ncbi:MAG: hypothetical protein ACI83P_000604 [Janthinobacterium sp.]|jgi:hypothetical protein